MAKLIKLDSENVVAADRVGGLKVAAGREGVSVIFKDGSSHWIPNDFRKSPYDTMARLHKEIEEALS